MEFTPLSFPLKDGRTAVLRSVCGTDAAAMIRLKDGTLLNEYTMMLKL